MALLGLSKKTDYGLKMLTLLAVRGDHSVVSAAQMVTEKKLPKAFVSQIAKDLVKAGILGSKEGKGGGYYLKKEPDKVSVKDVFVAMEGRVAPVACMQGKKCACKQFCEQRPFMTKLAKDMEGILSSYSLMEVINAE